MAPKILILNGPNLNLLGTRQPELYGADTLADVEARCRVIGGDAVELTFRQTNYEGELVTWIQDARHGADAIVINPAAYSHTSISLLDALYMFDGPVIEVHVSDIHKREEFRHFSYVSERADEVIVGRGVQGYYDGLRQAAERLGVTL